MCEVEDKGGRRINRTRKEGACIRRISKTIGKTNWYKERRRRYLVVNGERRKIVMGGRPPIPKEVRECSKKVDKGPKPKETEAVIFVPCTPGGLLQRQIQEEEDRFTAGTKLKRIRVVERGGTKIKDLICSGDPWSSMRCKRPECLLCSCKESTAKKKI